MSDITTSSTITINASRDEIWKALTTPDLIKQWFFGVDTETDWKVGSPLVHRGEWQSKPYEDKGKILQINPPNTLVHTHWSAMSGRRNQPEHYQRVTWTLADRNDATELTVVEVNLPSEEAKSTSDQAWKMVLSNLKQLLERGTAPNAA